MVAMKSGHRQRPTEMAPGPYNCSTTAPAKRQITTELSEIMGGVEAMK